MDEEFPDVDGMDIEEFERFLSRKSSRYAQKRSRPITSSSRDIVVKKPTDELSTLDAKLDYAKK
jgi:hypothetical protein